MTALPSMSLCSRSSMVFHSSTSLPKHQLDKQRAPAGDDEMCFPLVGVAILWVWLTAGQTLSEHMHHTKGETSCVPSAVEHNLILTDHLTSVKHNMRGKEEGKRDSERSEVDREGR